MIREENLKSAKKSNILLKTSFWYTISSFLSKGIVFIMIPFYVRLMTKEEYGNFSNLTSWITLIAPTVLMNLQLFIMKVYNKNPEELPSYVVNAYYTILFVLFIIMFPVIVFKDFFLEWTQLTDLNLFIIITYSALVPMFYLYTGFLRASFKIKEYVVVNIAIAIITAGLSLALLVFTPNEYRLYAFIIGQNLPIIGYSVYYLLRSLFAEKKINKNKIKECLSIGIPTIPHLLGITILSKIDRIMITSIISPIATADYSVANNLALIITTFSVALNNAFVPWQTKQLNEKNFSSIRKPLLYQIVLLSIITLGISLLAPEVMIIWASRKYADVVYIIPPLLVSVLLTHIYTIFYNIELFYDSKKTIIFSSIFAAIFNVVTNYIFLNIFGYKAAAYTTLFSNLLLLILHFLTVKSIKRTDVLPVKSIVLIVLFSMAAIYPIILLYEYIFLKYITILVSALGLTVYSIYNRSKILNLFLGKRNG